MDTQSYLMSLGWAGPGHPLHPSAYKQKGHRGLAYNPDEVRSTSTGRGLIKPLLVSRKENNLGVGRRAHEPRQGNEWWLKGFEKALGDVGKSESERSSGVSTPVNGYERKHSGLYSFFVKGPQMEGTIGEDGKMIRRKKRKSDAISSEEDGASEKNDTATDFKAVATFLSIRDQDKKTRYQPSKSTPREEFAQAGEYFQMRDATSRKKSKSDQLAALRPVEDEKVKSAPEVRPRAKREFEALSQPDPAVETKEERRDRRRKRKKEKEARMIVTSDPASPAGGEPLDAAAAKAARKHERRKRKTERAAVP